MRGYRRALHGARIQGQAGSRQHSLLRSCQRVLALHPGAAAGRRLQHRRWSVPNCSMLEAIAACERYTRKPVNWSYSDQNRTGDHIWWISDVRRFQTDYPGWRYRYDIDAVLGEII